MMKKIIIFGHGYVSKFLTRTFNNLGWATICTSRKIEIGTPIKNGNLTVINFFDPMLTSMIQSSHVILSTIPPNENGIDPVLENYSNIIAKSAFRWVGYLSSTSVYGDHDGAWIDEKTECTPSHEKARNRLSIERQWLNLYYSFKLPVHVFRLSGIYGRNRNCLEDIIMGKDFTVIKKNHYFSRIHIEDLCQGIIASIKCPTPGEIYNMSDGEPAPLHIVQQFGATILGKYKLKEILEEKAALSEQFKIFFQDNKKVNGQKIIKKLGINLLYPNYRWGLLKGCLPYLNNSN